jgi:UDP-N-acetylglucosamine acyltransferase
MTHSLYFVHPNAKIGKNVIIDPFVTIEENVVIGDETHIYSNATIMNGARIGKNCHIYPGAVISCIPQDLKFQGEDTTVEIGDYTSVRECATINRGTLAKGKTIVGSNCLLMAYSHVAHDCMLGNHVIVGNATQLAGEVEVDDWAIVSAGTLVHQFCRIGAHVMIQGGSRITKDIPPFVTAEETRFLIVGLIP